MYPTCIRQIFKAAITDLNDDEKGIEKIKFNPWLKSPFQNLTVQFKEPSVQRHVGSFSIVPYLQPKCFLLFQNLAET